MIVFVAPCRSGYMSREMSTVSSATVKDRQAGDKAESVPVISRRLRSAACLQHDVPTPPLDSTFVFMYTLSKNWIPASFLTPWSLVSSVQFSYVTLYEFFVKNLWKIFSANECFVDVPCRATKPN